MNETGSLSAFAARNRTLFRRLIWSRRGSSVFAHDNATQASLAKGIRDTAVARLSRRR